MNIFAVLRENNPSHHLPATWTEQPTMRSSSKLTFITIELSSLTCFSMKPKLKRDVHPFCTNRATLHEKILSCPGTERYRPLLPVDPAWYPGIAFCRIKPRDIRLTAHSRKQLQRFQFKKIPLHGIPEFPNSRTISIPAWYYRLDAGRKAPGWISGVHN